MRMRSPKNKTEILDACEFYLDENMFSNDNPIYLEIGIGKGDFILNMALSYPNINFIGVEKQTSVAVVAIKKINNYKPKNLKILISDVKEFPSFLLNKIDLIYLNFSDPWPKKGHAKRRLTHENFLKIYDFLFKKKKHIILKTDNADFYQFSKKSLLDYGYVIINESLDLHNSNIRSLPTEYERKFSSLGYKIKYIEVEKKP